MLLLSNQERIVKLWRATLAGANYREVKQLMAYNEKQRKLRRCKKIKANGEQCRSYSKIDGDGRCALHLYDHKTKVLPKANEREATRIRRAKNVKPQKRTTCSCDAYSFVHRLSSGFCAYPDPVLRQNRIPMPNASHWSHVTPVNMLYPVFPSY